MSLTAGSLFSGVGGCDLGIERAGMSVRWQVEIDAAARSVLRRHWPDTTIHEDVRHVGRHNLEPVDLVCGGFPCQDISVAGRRAGLAGERSGLWWEFHRVVAELRPRWVLIENVPGLLSSNGGRDMGAVLGGLGQLGYGYAYAVLDAQFFGVPQRRRRVFIVGHSGDWGAPAQVLLEPEGVRGDTPPRRAPGQDATGSLRASAASRGYNDNGDTGVNLVAGTVSAKWSKGTGGPSGDAVLHLVAATWDERNVTSRANRTRVEFGSPANTLHAEGLSVVTHALTSEGADASEDGTGRGTPLVAFTCKDSGQDAGQVAPTLRAMPHDQSHANGGGQVAVAFTDRTRDGVKTPEWQADLAYALMNPGAGGRSDASRVLTPQMAVRRLSPRECERLQGFPDDWTAGQSDSARYRQMGNAIAVPVAAWIARRIVAHERGA